MENLSTEETHNCVKCSFGLVIRLLHFGHSLDMLVFPDGMRLSIDCRDMWHVMLCGVTLSGMSKT